MLIQVVLSYRIVFFFFPKCCQLKREALCLQICFEMFAKILVVSLIKMFVSSIQKINVCIAVNQKMLVSRKPETACRWTSLFRVLLIHELERVNNIVKVYRNAQRLKQDPVHYNFTVEVRFLCSMGLLGNSISFSIETPGALPFTSELVQSLLNVHRFQTFSWKKR